MPKTYRFRVASGMGATCLGAPWAAWGKPRIVEPSTCRNDGECRRPRWVLNRKNWHARAGTVMVQPCAGKLALRPPVPKPPDDLQISFEKPSAPTGLPPGEPGRRDGPCPQGMLGLGPLKRSRGPRSELDPACVPSRRLTTSVGRAT